jgi:hypothetical protein
MSSKCLQNVKMLKVINAKRLKCLINVKMSIIINAKRLKWEMIIRLNLMRSKFIFSWGRIHEIEFFVTFHEVKIPNNDSISWSWHFSWDRNCLIVRKSIIRQFWSHDRFVSCKYNHEIKIQNKALLGNFDLMINLLAACTIMRSNVFMQRWLIIKAKN